MQQMIELAVLAVIGCMMFMAMVLAITSPVRHISRGESWFMWSSMAAGCVALPYLILVTLLG